MHTLIELELHPVTTDFSSRKDHGLIKIRMFVTKEPVFSPPFLSFFLSLSYVTMNLCLVPRSISHLMILLLSTFVLLIYHFFPLHCVLPTPLFFYFPPACIICIYPTLFPLSSSISLQLLDFASLSSPLAMPSFLLTFSPGHSSSL